MEGRLFYVLITLVIFVEKLNAGTPVRLVDGPHRFAGRLEVFYKGEWGSVCGDYFDADDADVVCGMITNFTATNRNATVYNNSYYGSSEGPVWITHLQCNGSEDDLFFCQSNKWERNAYCPSYYQNVALDCNTQVRFQSGNDGLVSIVHNGEWGTVCNQNFGRAEAEVICRTKGLGTRDVTYDWYGYGTGPTYVVDCNGDEEDISDCYVYGGWHYCSHSQDVTLRCGPYEGQARLSGGSYDFGTVEIFSGSQWGTICDDDFDHNDVKVICRMLGLYWGENYGVVYESFTYYGSGHTIVGGLQCYGYESNIKQCSSSPWYNCSHGGAASLGCHAYYNNNQTTSFPTTTYSTYPWWLTSTYPWWHTNQPYTTTYNPWYFHTTPGYTLQDVIRVNCNEYTWSIIVDLNRLRQLYPNAKGSDIYFGENTCVGIERDGHLTFQQGFTECLTTEMLRGDVHVYMNELIYAERDPVYLYIIRHYNWTVNVECDVMRDGSVQGGFQTGTNAPKPSENSLHYPVNISYYLDPNYMQEVSGHPLHADVGSQIYVKVFTTTFDWNVRMRVHTCYTKPTPNAPDHLKYYLLKNGCEADTNTHIISQSTHETRFVFDDFEYTSNHEGLYVFCDVTFCQNQDWSQQCRQTCNPIVKRSVRLTDTKSALLPEK